MRSRFWVLLCGGLLVSAPASGHDLEKGPNGGPQVSVGDRHLEFTMDGANIVVHVSDASHAPVELTGAAGRAVVQYGGKMATVTLAPAEGSKLVGKGEQAPGKGARVVVSATLPGGRNVQARFVVPE